MDKVLRRTKTGLIITGIGLTLLGVIMFMAPLTTLTVIILIVGWMLLALGVVTIVDSVFHRKDVSSSFGLGITVGIIEAVIGLCIVIWPASFLVALYVVLGVIVTLSGIGDIGESLSMRKEGFKNWWLALVMGILTLVLGVLAIVSPFAFAAAMMVITGIALVFDGITEVIAGIMLPSSSK